MIHQMTLKHILSALKTFLYNQLQQLLYLISIVREEYIYIRL